MNSDDTRHDIRDSGQSADRGSDHGDPEPLASKQSQRRQLFRIAVGAGLGSQALQQVQAAKPPEKMRPQPGDRVVHRFGDKRGMPVKPEDVPEGAEMLQVSAMDPESGVIRDGSRLNGINLVRVDPADFDEVTKPYSAEGIVAYSSVCTHQGCDLTQWLPETRTFKCYCHYSEFDASKQGVPNHGPARRNLAALPLGLSDQQEFVVADKFVGKVGFKK